MFGIRFTSGSRRNVLLIGRWAIKFPILSNWVAFIAGIRENLEERYWWCSESGVSKTWRHPHLAEIHWADRWGLVVVQRRYENHEDTSLTDLEWTRQIRAFVNQAYAKNSQVRPSWLGDCSETQFGWDGTKMVLLDYGWFGGTHDYYLGFPNGFSLIRSVVMKYRAIRMNGLLRKRKERQPLRIEASEAFAKEWHQVSNAHEAQRLMVARLLGDSTAKPWLVRKSVETDEEIAYTLRITHQDSSFEYLDYVVEVLDSSPKGAAYRNHGHLGGRWIPVNFKQKGD